MRLFMLFALCLLVLPSQVFPACDCASTDQANPCTGTSIVVTVTSTDPNSSSDIDSVFTWTFNSGGSDAACGQFANGDYWVAPASGESDVTITAITGSDVVSVDADPVMEAMGIGDGANAYGNYDSTEDLIANSDLPVTYSTTTSLVAAMNHDETTINCGTGATPAIVGECIDSYNVVTVLASVPANAGSTVLRPNITGESKVLLNLSDFDFTRLPEKSYLTGTDTAGYEEIRQRWSHSTEIFSIKVPSDLVAGYFFSEGGRAFRSRILIDDYSAGVGRQFNNDLMMIFSDEDPLADKQAALVAMMTYGLDLYHNLFNNPAGTTRDWGSGAGQHPGKFLSSVLLASLMVDSTYANTLRAIGPAIDRLTHVGPHELVQVNEGKNFPTWGDSGGKFQDVNYHGAYWQSLWSSYCYDDAPNPDLCPVNTGDKNQHDPYGYVDGPPNGPGTSYMDITLGGQRAMVAAMYLMPEICDTVNYDMMSTYVIRVATEGLKTADDPCLSPDDRSVHGDCDVYRNTGNCPYYGTTWGPIDVNDRESDCIEAGTSAESALALAQGHVTVGRFIGMDGDAFTSNTAYTSSQVEANWATIVTASSCERSTATGTFLNIGSSPHFN